MREKSVEAIKKNFIKNLLFSLFFQQWNDSLFRKFDLKIIKKYEQV